MPGRKTGKRQVGHSRARVWRLPSEEEGDIDYPLAFVASSPIQVWDSETITLKGKDIALRGEQEEGDDEGQDEGRDLRPSRPRRPGQPGVLDQ